MPNCSRLFALRHASELALLEAMPILKEEQMCGSLGKDEANA